MNRIVFIIISLLMIFSILVACSQSSDETTGANEDINDNQNEEKATEPEDSNENNDSNATDEESSSGYIMEEGDDLDLPEDFPADIPIPDLDESSITYVVAGAESAMGIAYHIELEYSGDNSITDMIDIYREYADNNFDEDEKSIEEEENSARYIGYIDGVEHDFVIYESTLEEALILIKIVISAEE